jgi:hypothetical protein
MIESKFDPTSKINTYYINGSDYETFIRIMDESGCTPEAAAVKLINRSNRMGITLEKHNVRLSHWERSDSFQVWVWVK